MKVISDRLSVKNHGDYDTIVISTKIDKRLEALMAAWLFCWTLCGAYFIYEFIAGGYERQMKMYIFIMISFWLYFEYRIGKAYLMRRMGMEFLMVKEGKLYIKRAVKNWGKSKDYFLENISNLIVVERKEKAISTVMENSFWVIGGEMLEFEYLGKTIRFGIQLSKEEAEKLKDFILKKIKETKNNA
jgi:hypothetical protein